MRRGVGLGAALALIVLPVAAAAPAAAVDKPLYQESKDYWTTLAAPRVEQPPDDSAHGVPARPTWFEQAQTAHHLGFPPAAQELARREAVADQTGKEPATMLREAGAKTVQQARLLTLLVEFNPNANDDFSGWARPDHPSAPEGCVTEPPGTLLNGPLHNELPDPATRGRGTDNNTFWVPDFSPKHYDDIIYSSEGLRRKVRRDLNGGYSFKGRSVRNFYLEMSKGTYELTGTVTPWLQVPHSEAWYSADTCEGGPASDAGHPDNPRGTPQMAIDAVTELANQQPDFPWDDYDIEDQGDFDDDGDLYEPDGVLDHVIVVHAGADQADDGGEQGSYAEWSSAQAVDPGTGGYLVPGTGKRVFNFTTQAEDLGVGVVAHEYGHDLGLPDLYDILGPGDTDVAFWDLMSTGSHSGELFQMGPAHMGAWSKYVLGWVQPRELEYGGRSSLVTLGQASRPPKGTDAAVKINMPDKHVTIGEPHGGEHMWWSNQDQSFADVRLTRSLDVPQGEDVRFWSWDDYVIEEFYDYGFIEVSADGGSTWEQLVVRDEAGNVVSTSEDPNGVLAGNGGLENGLTGSSEGFRHDWVDLTPYAGQTIQLRLRYTTDAGFEERGWFADDFSVTADGATVWSDGVENDLNGWTPVVESFGGTSGAGWIITTGEFDFARYYLAEWRNFDGFDEGLKHTYDTNWFVDGEWNVNKEAYNAPGLLLWYRDEQYTNNALSAKLFDLPSLGSKGSLLLVDSHFEPLRRRGDAAAADPSFLKNLFSRQQAGNAAFGLVGQYPFRSCLPRGDDPYDVACNRFGTLPGQRSFTDAKGWYPGVEYRPDLDPEDPWFARDVDASVVVPSKGNELYSTRVVDARGRLQRQLFGQFASFAPGFPLGTGNPEDGRPPAADGSVPGTRADLSLGVDLQVLSPRRRNTEAIVRVRPGHPGN